MSDNTKKALLGVGIAILAAFTFKAAFFPARSGWVAPHYVPPNRRFGK